MSKHMLLESLLNDEYEGGSLSSQGVCQSCGHYTKIDMNCFGTRICNKCENAMKTNKEKR